MVGVVLVTGGASGLGLATVKWFLKCGKKVVFFDLPQSNGVKIAEELGSDVLFVECDVTSEDDVTQGFAKIRETFGRLDVCINCAGILLPNFVIDSQTREPNGMAAIRRIFEVNFFGTYNVIRLATSLMAENEPNEDGQRGVIINTASIAGSDGQAKISGYSSSKAAVAGLTLPLARELGSLGIRVMAISPGLMDTPMVGGRNAAGFDKYLSGTPFPKRAGRPEEYAKLCEAIVENPYLNGETIRLDGGSRYLT